MATMDMTRSTMTIARCNGNENESERRGLENGTNGGERERERENIDTWGS